MTAPPAEADGAATGRKARPQIGIRSQYVKDLSFENPAAPERRAQAEGAPDIAVDVQVEARRLADGAYEVSLKITANARRDKASVFLLELTYDGVSPSSTCRRRRWSRRFSSNARA